jgi:hypothetical protein
MHEAVEGDGSHPVELPGGTAPMRIELGGPIQERGLPDHGRLIIKREGIVLEGSMPALVTGVGVAGTVGCAVIAEQPGGLLPGLTGMGVILVHTLVYFRAGVRRPRIVRRAIPPRRKHPQH